MRVTASRQPGDEGVRVKVVLPCFSSIMYRLIVSMILKRGKEQGAEDKGTSRAKSGTPGGGRCVSSGLTLPDPLLNPLATSSTHSIKQRWLFSLRLLNLVDA
jgi:hypothetical protein